MRVAVATVRCRSLPAAGNSLKGWSPPFDPLDTRPSWSRCRFAFSRPKSSAMRAWEDEDFTQLNLYSRTS
jgi:hypothetical protein